MEVHSGHTYRGGLRDLNISHETTKDTDNAMSLQVVFELICKFYPNFFISINYSFNSRIN